MKQKTIVEPLKSHLIENRNVSQDKAGQTEIETTNQIINTEKPLHFKMLKSNPVS